MSVAPSLSTLDDQEMSVASSATTPSQRRRKPVPVHRCRFPDWTPSAVAALTITPRSFDTALLNFGGASAERGILGVGRANGDVELMCWGGHQGWVAWRTLPSSFPVAAPRASKKKPVSQLSHLLFTHQTTLSPSDLTLYDGDLEGAAAEVRRWEHEGVRLFGVGGAGSELVEWEWGGPGASKEVGRVKSTLPTLPPIFALAASRTSSHLAIGCEDSTIRILNILDDELELISKIEVGGPGKVRALSLAWGPPVALSKGKAREAPPEDASSLPAHFATPVESYLIAGCSNSSIRRFDAPSSCTAVGVWKSVHRMTVDQLKGEQTVVWAVVVLQDGTIVSGDSMGNIKFWDGVMGTQTQSFKTHKVDVLCLTVGSTGTSLFSSGVDQKTSEFRLVSVASSRTKSGPAARWIQASGRRLHSHDVRAMVVSPPYTLALPSPPPSSSTPLARQVPILTSGGLDLSLVIVSVSPAPLPSSRPLPALKNSISDTPSTEFETTIHRRAAYVPQRSRPFAVAPDARLLVCRRARSIGVWKLEDPKGAVAREEIGRSGWSKRKQMFGLEEEEVDEAASAKGWSKVVEMELKLQTNLVASAVSPDGKWLAVSDLYETKLFRLQLKDGEISPRRQKTFSTSLSAALPTSLGTGSSSLLFTNDSSRLILATSFGSSIAVVDLPTNRDEVFQVVRVFSDHAERDGTREIRGLATRANGKANGDGDVAMNGVNGNGVHHETDSDGEDEEMDGGAASGTRGDKPATVACLAVSTDGKWLASADLERKVCVFDLEHLKHYTTLPTPPQVPTALIFLPPSPLTEPTLVLVLPNNALSLFSLTSHRFLPWSLPLSSLLSNTLMDIREPALGVTFEPRSDTISAVAAGKTKIHESRLAALWSDQILVVWGANWVAKVDLDEVRSGTAAPGKMAPVRREADRKRAREEEGAPKNGEVSKVDIRVTRRYQPLVLFDFVGQAELVAVERVWWDLAKELPEAWAQSSQFGT